MIYRQAGQLSKRDILANKLICPQGYEKNYKAASYDITPTAIAMSTRSGMLETVFVDRKKLYQNEHYIYVHPKDSVLIISNEFIRVPANIAGYISSRVSNVARGFGHICTTIDPGWNGAVLIALSNPTNKPIRIEVGINGKKSYPLATMTFHYLSRKVFVKSEHGSMRLDLLETNAYFNKKGLRSALRKLFSRKRRIYTDAFFDYIDAHKDVLNSADGWNCFLDEFSRFTGEHSKAFVKRDSWIKSVFRWFETYRVAIGICIAIICILFSLLCTLGLLSDEQIKLIQSLFDFLRGVKE